MLKGAGGCQLPFVGKENLTTHQSAPNSFLPPDVHLLRLQPLHWANGSNLVIISSSKLTPLEFSCPMLQLLKGWEWCCLAATN